MVELLHCPLNFSAKDTALTKFLSPCLTLCMSLPAAMIESSLTSVNSGVFKIQSKDFKTLLAWQVHFYKAHIPK